jgi:hypothetical protein
LGQGLSPHSRSLRRHTVAVGSSASVVCTVRRRRSPWVIRWGADAPYNAMTRHNNSLSSYKDRPRLPNWILGLVPPGGDHRRVMPGISRRASLRGISAARVPSFGPAPTSFHPHFGQSITIRHGCETASFRTSERRHIKVERTQSLTRFRKE